MSVVVLSPGQGQIPADLPALLASADDDLHAAYVDRLGEDAVQEPEGSMASLQAALIVVGIGRGRRVLRQLAARKDAYGPIRAFAGHSLGEITALALAGVLVAGDAIRLAADRGDAFEHARGDGWHGVGMLALSGPTLREQIDRLFDDHDDLYLANDNAPDQIVVSGAAGSLAELTTSARDLGLRAVRLETTGPGHSPYMAPAVPAFRAALERVTLHPATAEVWSGATASPMTQPIEQLSTTLAAPLRWRETLLGLGDLGITGVVDTGPGTAMARLARKTLPDLPTLSLEDLEAAA